MIFSFEIERCKSSRDSYNGLSATFLKDLPPNHTVSFELTPVCYSPSYDPEAGTACSLPSLPLFAILSIFYHYPVCEVVGIFFSIAVTAQDFLSEISLAHVVSAVVVEQTLDLCPVASIQV